MLKKTDAGTPRFVLDGITSRQLIEAPGAGDTWKYYAGNAEADTTIAATAALHQLVVVFSGASSKFYLDGTDRSSPSDNPGTGALTGINVGTDSTHTVNFMLGDIAELVVIASAITGPDRASWNAYTLAKWGV